MVTDNNVIQKRRRQQLNGAGKLDSPVPDLTVKSGWSPILVGALLCVGCVLVMPFDQYITRWLELDHLPGDVVKAIALSEFFAHGFGVITIITGVAILVPGYRSSIIRLVACAFVPGLLAQVIKFMVGRIRPLAFNSGFDPGSSTWLGLFPHLHEKPAGMDWYSISSFPSGHAATSMGLAVGMSCLFPRGKCFFFTLACLASFQRIASEAHWTSDVVFSMGLALIVAMLIVRSQKTNSPDLS